MPKFGPKFKLVSATLFFTRWQILIINKIVWFIVKYCLPSMASISCTFWTSTYEWMMMNERCFGIDWHVETEFHVLAHESNSSQKVMPLWATSLCFYSKCCVQRREAANTKRISVFWICDHPLSRQARLSFYHPGGNNKNEKHTYVTMAFEFTLTDRSLEVQRTWSPHNYVIYE